VREELMKSYPRNARVEEEIRKVLAELLLYEVKDPRLSGVVISAVDLSPDRTSCQVYFSVVGDAEREREVVDGFAAAATYLRRMLGRSAHLRVTPELKFRRDRSYEHGDRMERLFERLHAQGVMPDDDQPGPDEGE